MIKPGYYQYILSCEKYVDLLGTLYWECTYRSDAMIYSPSDIALPTSNIYGHLQPIGVKLHEFHAFVDEKWDDRTFGIRINHEKMSFSPSGHALVVIYPKTGGLWLGSINLWIYV